LCLINLMYNISLQLKVLKTYKCCLDWLVDNRCVDEPKMHGYTRITQSIFSLIVLCHVGEVLDLGYIVHLPKQKTSSLHKFQ
jgi:hypothetical protein